MSIQNLINKSSAININKRKSIGQTISRSGVIKTSLQQASLYRFTVVMSDGLVYSANRGLLEDLDTQDRNQEANVDIGTTNTGLSYITAYQGDTSQSDLGNISMLGNTGANIYVDCSGLTSGATTLFKKGDYIQPLGNTSTYRYPYQVTSDVAYSTSSNVTIPVHRPVRSQTDVDLTTGGFRTGSAVRFHVKALVMPTYTVIPYDRISFDSDLELIEVLE